MNKRDAYRANRRVWKELSKTGKDKHSIPELANIINQCYLCEYVFYKTNEKPGNRYSRNLCLKHCPVIWLPKDNGVCFDNDSLWRRWNWSYLPEKRKQLAKRIYNLPMRKKS